MGCRDRTRRPTSYSHSWTFRHFMQSGASQLMQRDAAFFPQPQPTA